MAQDPDPLTDPTTYTVTEALAALEARALTSVQLVEAFLARIEAYEPHYNAFTQLNPAALEEAKASDTRRALGEPPRALEGVPIVVKDSVDMAGLPTTDGWPVTTPACGGLALVPAKDAPVVVRLREAGAVIIGKTNLPRWAYSGSNADDSADGPTYNILDRRWAPGGSSTGTATAVAGDFAIAGLAEETGGSIQNPAAAQSLYAIKPTFGLVPTTGGVPQCGSTRDVLGPITKSIEDAALLLDVMAGPHPDDPKTHAAQVPAGGYTSQLSTTALQGARIGLYGPGWRGGRGALTTETADLYAAAVDRLRSRGAVVIEDPFADTDLADLAVLDDQGYDSRGQEYAAYEMDRYLAALGPTAPVHSLAELLAFAQASEFTDKPLELLAAGDPEQTPDLTPFLQVRDAYLAIIDSVFATHRLDALCFPQQIAPIGDSAGDTRGGETVHASTVSEINIAQLPGVVLPDGAYHDGRPFALIFLGPQWSEAELLGYAYDYTSANPGRMRRPDLGSVRFPCSTPS
ncbi:amidase [Nocardioides sp. KR10-350]|uniref:amidase n=1 Tax=Nocardioides cheoyonin TaxID=3156615 RepID=UPI0032B3914A